MPIDSLIKLGNTVGESLSCSISQERNFSGNTLLEVHQIQRWIDAEVPGESQFILTVLHMVVLSSSRLQDLLPRLQAHHQMLDFRPTEAVAAKDKSSPELLLTALLHRLAVLHFLSLSESVVLPTRVSASWLFHPPTPSSRPFLSSLFPQLSKL